MSSRAPVVAIVGRQNVGKSSLFNRLAGKRIAIVDPKPGTTIDRIEHTIQYREARFVLVDTGGLGGRRDEPYHVDVERQVEYALQAADAVILLADVVSGMTDVDRETARELLRGKKPVVLAVNKVDSASRQLDVAEFYKLGLGEPVALSVIGNRGVDDLMDRVAALLPPRAIEAAEASPEVRIAIVGQRNVGKSTYVNALAGQERVIVSERPGTTRDAVDVAIERDGRRLVIIDTAGLRKRTRVENSVELFGQMRSEGAIHRAHGVLLMLEAHRPISDVEKRIGQMVERSYKPVVVALNKWDLVRKENRDTVRFEEYLERAFPVISFAPLCLLAAKQGLGVWEPIEALLGLVEASRTRVGTGELNRVIARALRSAPPPLRGTKEGRILYATQTQGTPPTFVFFVRHKSTFSGAYLKHLERTMRETLREFDRLPMRILLREKKMRG